MKNLLLSLIALLLVACNQSPAPVSNPVAESVLPAPDQEVAAPESTITLGHITHPGSGNWESGLFVESLFQEYMTKNPGITIKTNPIYSFIRDREEENLFKQAPTTDIFGVEMRIGNEFAHLIETKQIMSIQELFKEEPILDEFYPSLLAPATFGGQCYGIPWSYETEFLVCDMELLGAAGLDAPSTWAEFASHIKTLTKKTEIGKQFGLWLSTANDTLPYSILAKIHQDGGALLTDEGYDLSHAAVEGAFQYFRDLDPNGEFIYRDFRPSLNSAIGEDEGRTFAMLIVPIEQVQKLMGEEKYRVLPLPTDKIKVQIARGVQYLAVHRDVAPEKLEAIRKLLRFICTPNPQTFLDYMTPYRGCPVNKGMAETLTSPNNGHKIQGVECLLTTAAFCIDYGPQFEMRLPAGQRMWPLITPYLEGKRDFDQVAKVTAKRANEALGPRLQQQPDAYKVE